MAAEAQHDAHVSTLLKKLGRKCAWCGKPVWIGRRERTIKWDSRRLYFCEESCLEEFVHGEPADSHLGREDRQVAKEAQDVAREEAERTPQEGEAAERAQREEWKRQQRERQAAERAQREETERQRQERRAAERAQREEEKRQREAAERAQAVEAWRQRQEAIAAMQKWEYQVIKVAAKGTIDSNFDEMGDNKLNALGSQGWELVSVTVAARGGGMSVFAYYYFKRPKP